MSVRWLGEKPGRATTAIGTVKGEFPLAPTAEPAERFRVFIAWTTVANRPDADRLAADAVTRNLAVCAQVDGPITSHYRWQGQIERSEEFRVTFKCLPSHLEPLERHVLATHPYDTPQWLVAAADRVGEKYLSWATANSSTPPL
jgi:periplasmic divalent cation tolerance protein